MVTRKLVQIGNSRGVILPKPILELLGWTTGVSLELQVDGRTLIASPVPIETKPAPGPSRRKKKV